MRETLQINNAYIFKTPDGKEELNVKITGVLGAGASCLVYDGEYRDSFGFSHDIRVKECMPYYCTAPKRADGVVCWNSDLEKEKALELFKNTYGQHLYLQKMFANTATHIDKLYEANNTRYIIMNMDEGKSFEKVRVSSFYSLCKTLHALGEAVKRYHEHGMLHLDLKPENFMLLESMPDETVKLFDFDSVIFVNDLKEGIPVELSYSEKWAAPEVKQRKYAEIRETADIYSVGAILFYYLAGRHYELKDLLSFGKYDWLSDAPLLQGINPAVFRRIKELLNATLAASLNHRYQTMEEVCLKLKELIRLSDPKSMYLKNTIPRQNNLFVGRNTELSEIHTKLQSSNCLLINGMGGIGKTELAKAYAIRYKEEYSHIVYISCQGSIEESILDDTQIVITNYSIDKQEKFAMDRKKQLRNRIALLKQVVDEDTLFIFDDIREFDDSLNQLLTLKCKFILTSREFPRALLKKRETFCVEELSVEHLLELFTQILERTPSEEEKAIIRDIIAEVNRYTILVPIIAKIMNYYGMSPVEMLARLKDSSLKDSSDRTVKHCKDDRTVEETMYGHVQTLFSFTEVGELELAVMKTMAVLEPYMFDRNFLALIFIIDDWVTYFVDEEYQEKVKEDTERFQITYAAMSRLIDLGWFSYDKEIDCVQMHPVIAEVLMEQQDCGVVGCERLYDFVQGLMILLLARENQNKENYIENQFKKIDVDDNLRIYQDKDIDYKEQIQMELATHCLLKLDVSKEENVKYLIQKISNYHPKLLNEVSYEVLNKIRVLNERKQQLDDEFMVALYMALITIVESKNQTISEADIKEISDCAKRISYHNPRISEWHFYQNAQDFKNCMEAKLALAVKFGTEFIKTGNVSAPLLEMIVYIMMLAEEVDVTRLSREQRRELKRTIERGVKKAQKDLGSQRQPVMDAMKELDSLEDKLQTMLQEQMSEYEEEERQGLKLLLNCFMGNSNSTVQTVKEEYQRYYEYFTSVLKCEEIFSWKEISSLLENKQISVSDKISLLCYLENSPYDAYSIDLENHFYLPEYVTNDWIRLIQSVLLKNQYYETLFGSENRQGFLAQIMFAYRKRQYDLFLKGIRKLIERKEEFSQELLFAWGQFCGKCGLTLLELIFYSIMNPEKINEDSDGNGNFLMKYLGALERCALKEEDAQMVLSARTLERKYGNIIFFKGKVFPEERRTSGRWQVFMQYLFEYCALKNRQEQQEFLKKLEREVNITEKYKELFRQGCTGRNHFMDYMYAKEVVGKPFAGNEEIIKAEQKRLKQQTLTAFEKCLAYASCGVEYLLLDDIEMADACIMRYTELVGQIVPNASSVELMMLFEFPNGIYEWTKYREKCVAVYQGIFDAIYKAEREISVESFKILMNTWGRSFFRMRSMLRSEGLEEEASSYVILQNRYEKSMREAHEGLQQKDYAEFNLAARSDYSIPLSEYAQAKRKSQLIDTIFEFGEQAVWHMLKMEMGKPDDGDDTDVAEK